MPYYEVAGRPKTKRQYRNFSQYIDWLHKAILHSGVYDKVNHSFNHITFQSYAVGQGIPPHQDLGHNQKSDLSVVVLCTSASQTIQFTKLTKKCKGLDQDAVHAHVFQSVIELHHGDMYILGPEDDKKYHHELKPLMMTGDRFGHRTAVIFRLLQKYTFVNR